MNTLLLLRHGENLANLTKEFSYKDVDYSLTEKGRLQAQQTAAYLAQVGFDALYTSPLKRCLETADYIARAAGKPAQVLEDLRELNVGSLEGAPVCRQTWAIHEAVTAAWYTGQPETRFPGGENLLELTGRFRAALQQITAGRTGQTVVVVGHGGMFTFTGPSLWAGASWELLRGSHNPNCSISTVQAGWQGGQWHGRLLAWAAQAHLSGWAAEQTAAVPRLEELQSVPDLRISA